MQLTDEEFELGVCVVSVTCTDGKTHVEDWNPKDARQAKEYAKETSCCGDVKSVEYYNGEKSETVVFANGDIVPN